jgi:pimeloyl-ACP methyl ester carboxylesterase
MTGGRPECPSGLKPEVAGVVMDVNETKVEVWGSRLDMTVQVAGEGPPLLYLHAAGGMVWDPFLERLAGDHTIYAPLVPGTAPGNPEAIHRVDDLWDLVLIYEETIRSLGIDSPPVVAPSFGGMLACELAAHFPTLFSRLVLLDPIGLWLDDHPVANWVATAPEDMPALLFHDPGCVAARALFTPPHDPDAAITAIVTLTWATGCTSKFVWPIPDKGLAKRIHRIDVPTLVIWGNQEALVSSAYAEEFGRLIAGSRVEVLDACGHIPQLEQLDKSWSLVTGFLADA